MVIKLWVVLLLVGCTLANPWKRRLNDREIRRRESDDSITDEIIKINEEEDNTDLEEGDIKPDPGDDNEGSKRSLSLLDAAKLWTSRTVHYVISPELAANQKAVDAINGAIAQYHKHSCIKFVNSKDQYYINFIKGTGCWSHVGNIHASAGFQELSIGTGCEYTGIVMHELLHALGFWHEQSRPDRYTKIEIMWENIVAGKESNFNKQKLTGASKQNTPYDEDSIMQYGNKAFSSNGKDTIKVIHEPTKELGQRVGFSVSDIVALGRLYSCNVTNGGWSYWSTYSACHSNCKKFRTRFCTNANMAACDANKPTGIDTELVTCPDAECYAPVNGHWGRWGDWSACTTTCGDGTKQRTRVCDDPAAANGGAACPGSASQTVVCNLGDCNAAKGDCTFDNDAQPFCDWTQDLYDNKPKFKDWMRGSATPSSGTGPSSDRLGSGKFIYMESSDCINTEGKYVRLISPEYDATGSSGRCIKFYYHSKGATFKNFNVYIKPSSGAANKIATIPGQDRGDVWNAFNQHFTHTSSKYFVILESECGLDYRADFAIDDITFNDGACA